MSPDEALLALANDLLDETVEARLAERLAGRGISPDAAPGPPPAQAREQPAPLVDAFGQSWAHTMRNPANRAWTLGAMIKAAQPKQPPPGEARGG